MVLKTALRRVLAAAGADAAEASPEENNEDYREAALASLSRQLLGGGAVAESGISADTADHLRLLRQRLQLAQLIHLPEHWHYTHAEHQHNTDCHRRFL